MNEPPSRSEFEMLRESSGRIEAAVLSLRNDLLSETRRLADKVENTYATKSEVRQLQQRVDRQGSFWVWLATSVGILVIGGVFAATLYPGGGG